MLESLYMAIFDVGRNIGSTSFLGVDTTDCKSLVAAMTLSTMYNVSPLWRWARHIPALISNVGYEQIVFLVEISVVEIYHYPYIARVSILTLGVSLVLEIYYLNSYMEYYITLLFEKIKNK